MQFHPPPERLLHHPFEQHGGDELFAPLTPRLLGQFDPFRALHEHGHGDLVAMEMKANRDVQITFQGMAAYDALSVDFDVRSNVLTVTGRNDDKHAAEARRSISMPCVVTKPFKVMAEVHGGSCVVTVPSDAQGPLAESRPKRMREPKSLVVTIHATAEDALAPEQQARPGNQAEGASLHGPQSLEDALRAVTQD